MGSDEHLKTAFSFFDQNKSGYIEIEELREALANEFDTTSEEVVEAIILDVDTNKVRNMFCSVKKTYKLDVWMFLNGT